MLTKSTLHKAAKAVAQRRDEMDALEESCTAYADELVDEGLVRHRRDRWGQSEWLVVDDGDWWAIAAGRKIKAGPCDTKRELLDEMHADSASRVRDPNPGGGYLDGIYRIRGDVFAVRHDVAQEKGWV